MFKKNKLIIMITLVIFLTINIFNHVFSFIYPVPIDFSGRTNILGIELENSKKLIDDNSLFNKYSYQGKTMKNYNINGIHFPKGTELIYDDTYKWIQAMCPSVITNNQWVFEPNTIIKFYPDTSIKSAYIKYPIIVDGIKYGPGYILLSSNKNVLSGSLEFPITNKGHILSNKLSFFTNGNISYSHFLSTYSFQSNSFIGTLFFYPNGKLKSGFLVVPSVIQNYSFTTQQIMFYPNGKVKSGYIHGLNRLWDKTYEINSKIEFFSSGEIYNLETIPYYLNFINKTNIGKRGVCFYPNGKPSIININTNISYQGLTYEPDEIAFYDNGRLSFGYLYTNCLYNGYKLASGKISFYPDGNLKSFHLEKPIVLTNNNKIIYCIGILSLFSSGFIKETGFQGYYIQDGISYTGEIKEKIIEYDYSKEVIIGKNIEFYENGMVKRGTLSKDTIINGIMYKSKNSEIYFYESGLVKQAILARDTKINGIYFAENSEIIFYPDGQVFKSFLAQPLSIKFISTKIIIPKNTTVLFDPNGNLLGRSFNSENFKLYYQNQVVYPGMQGIYVLNNINTNVIEEIVVRLDSIKNGSEDLIKFNLPEYCVIRFNLTTLGFNYYITAFKSFIDGEFNWYQRNWNRTISFTYKANEWVTFYSYQDLKKAYLSKITELNGIIYDTNNWIEFYSSGLVKSGVLAKPLNGLMPGTRIYLTEDGKSQTNQIKDDED